MTIDDLYIVEYSPKQDQPHVEPVGSWTRKQLTALLETGRARGDGSWVVIGIAPTMTEALEFALAFMERYRAKHGGGKRQHDT